MPHMEGLHEIAGLRFLDGDPTVRLLEADEPANAMLLEKCNPGNSLRTLFQPEQDLVIAGLLKRFWKTPADPHPFRPLSLMIDHWIDETKRDESRWYDAALVGEGLDTFEKLASSSLSATLLATDLHAGNVLAAEREQWLVIDPKPFVGDTAFDGTQHLLNSRSRLHLNAGDTIRRIASLLDIDFERLRQWTFARLAAEPRDDWDDDATKLARLVRP
jgi:streptomycin 6-kinase